MKRVSVTVAVALLVLTAGCAGLGGGDGSAGGGGSGSLGAGGDAGGGDGAGAPGDVGGGQSDEAAAVGGQPLQTDRAIVRTATIDVRAEDFSTARSEIVGHAQSLDGYVSGSDATRHTDGDESWTTGHVVVRVPSDRFSGMLEFARERGTVLQEETQTEDVTEQLVDLQARLTNAQERRDRLRSFYDRANTTSALLDVEERLSSVQAEIERLQAQLRSLEDRVSYSTVRVRLVEPGASATADADARDSSLSSAFLESAGTAVDYFYGTVLFTVRLVPYLVLFGLPALAVGLLARRRYGWGSSPVGGFLSGTSRERSAPTRDDAPAESADESSGEE